MSMIGKTLAHYEITSQLGKGGMGEVYRAKDQKLGRDAAIKVLPEEFAKDADRAARFQREAKLLASLNHPNIAAIHGLEEADGTGEDEPLGSATDQVNFNPGSWSNDGKTLVTYGVPHLGADNFDIGAISIGGDRKWKPLLNEKYNETMPEISPDGRWMAYMSDESGQYEIYVRPFPEVNSDKWQVSQKGGMNALWSPDRWKLFYRSGDAVMVVPVGTEPTFKPGRAEKVLQGYPPTSFLGGIQSGWDIPPDGKRFLMLKPVESTGMASGGEAPRRIHVVLNWFEELKQRVPAE
jgi:hypothetical protein